MIAEMLVFDSSQKAGRAKPEPQRIASPIEADFYSIDLKINHLESWLSRTDNGSRDGYHGQFVLELRRNAIDRLWCRAGPAEILRDGVSQHP